MADSIDGFNFYPVEFFDFSLKNLSIIHHPLLCSSIFSQQEK
jgi:hypothetical protein